MNETIDLGNQNESDVTISSLQYSFNDFTDEDLDNLIRTSLSQVKNGSSTQTSPGIIDEDKQPKLQELTVYSLNLQNQTSASTLNESIIDPEIQENEHLTENEDIQSVASTIVLETVHERQENVTPENCNLEEYLKKTGEGKLILDSYRSNGEKLKKNIRSKLTRHIIRREKEHCLKYLKEGEKLAQFRLSTEYFKNVAKEIVTLFKGENIDTYFQPSFSIEGATSSQTGKLYAHYIYVRRTLRKLGHLQNDFDSEHTTEEIVDATEDEERLAWLETNVEPRRQLGNYWIKSFKSRRALLITDNLSVVDYMNRFLCLSTEFGKVLVRMYTTYNTLSDGHDYVLKKWM